LPEPEGSLSTSDRTLLLAFAAWGDPGFEAGSSRFSKDWRDRLRLAWTSMARTSSSEALAQLQSEHEASARPDLSRVHPSWLVRALKSESPAVQLAVTARVSSPIRRELCRALKLDSGDLQLDRPADPEATRWSLALWTERLVGDVPVRDDDPPVVDAMTKLGPRDLARLVKVSGLVKHAFALDGSNLTNLDESTARFTPIDRVRLVFFRRCIGQADPRLVPLARLDLQTVEGDHRRGHSHVGLLTFGRLLGAVEPHRARWASQHIPYSIARRMRIKETPTLPRKALLSWEAWILEAARARLLSEGRLAGGREDAPIVSVGAEH
jgi:hypothetical protein